MARIGVQVVEFYERHPINEGQVLEALRRRGKVAGALSPEDLYEWDQDHYGGVGAVEALARRAEVDSGSLVLDVCAGLGGPARFLAHRYGARVIGVDLKRARCTAGRRLSRLVALGYPVLVGASRKRFIGEITGVAEPSERVGGTIGANIAALERGARLFRVHDVKPSREALDVAWAIMRASRAADSGTGTQAGAAW